MNGNQLYTIYPLGDTALTIDFGNTINESINDRVLALFHKLQVISSPYILDVIPAYSSLTIHYNVYAILCKDTEDKTAYNVIVELVQKAIEGEDKLFTYKPKLIKIPVCYSQKYALDIQEIAEQKGLAISDIIRIHTSKTYKVYMVGFIPGFAYMGEVDERIAVPRKEEPRTKVTAGSVGIAGKQTGIYPLDSPGGWQIIGRTPLKLFNKDAPNPVLLGASDEIQFYSISKDEFENY